MSDYYRELVQKGHLTGFILEYVDDHRDKILKDHPDFISFKNFFNLDKKFMDDFFEYVKKEDPKLKFNEEEFKRSENLLKLRMKAVLAQDIWGYNEFYQIYNDSNEIVMRAVEILKEGSYENKLK
jgi:carboxyl-terminal processing protease